jgi:hypothetical protein
VAIPGDFDPVKRPLSLARGSKDNLLDENEIDQIKDIVGMKKDVASQISVYDGQVHCFSLRGD